jgi:signal transduction histidine kinase
MPHLQTRNRCLDDAVAEAVTEYSRQRERSIAQGETERLGVLTHELRNQLYAAILTFDTLEAGQVGVNGSTGGVLGRSQNRVDELDTRPLAMVRLESPSRKRERVSVSELLEEVEIDAAPEAHARGVELRVTPAPAGADIEVDRHILAAAVANLLQNAFKFSRPGSQVSLRVQATVDRVLIEVEDQCSGLPSGKIEELFQPFSQRGVDRSGMSLGLSISQRGVEANDGEIRARDLPGAGCVFTIDLPRMP